MNKKETISEEELDIMMGHTKKHKKHKHKKHRKKGKTTCTPLKGSTSAIPQEMLDSDTELASADGETKLQSSPGTGLKLKFKIGGQSIGQTSVAIVQDEADEENQLIEVVDDVATAASDISDEDAWLDALESGKLDEYDEMRRMKDPALMTARQKALLESKSQRLSGQIPEYFMLPLGYKEKEMTEEMIQKREQKAKKRRQQAQEKREKDKIETIDRLLKKQDPKPKGSKGKLHKKAAEVPKFTYVSSRDVTTISVPIGYSFPMHPQSVTNRILPQSVRCGVLNCSNLKRYSCSRSGVPLCSLECYKKNLELVPKISIATQEII